MSTQQFISTQITAGVWQGSIIKTGQTAPKLTASHEGTALDNVTVTAHPTDDLWLVAVPIPPHLINDGVQTVLIQDDAGKTLGHFSLLAGDVLAHDLQAEIALLRSELDMLKAAFRQHCHDS